MRRVSITHTTAEEEKGSGVFIAPELSRKDSRPLCFFLITFRFCAKVCKAEVASVDVPPLHDEYILGGCLVAVWIYNRRPGGVSRHRDIVMGQLDRGPQSVL